MEMCRNTEQERERRLNEQIEALNTSRALEYRAQRLEVTMRRVRELCRSEIQKESYGRRALIDPRRLLEIMGPL